MLGVESNRDAKKPSAAANTAPRGKQASAPAAAGSSATDQKKRPRTNGRTKDSGPKSKRVADPASAAPAKAKTEPWTPAGKHQITELKVPYNAKDKPTEGAAQSLVRLQKAAGGKPGCGFMALTGKCNPRAGNSCRTCPTMVSDHVLKAQRKLMAPPFAKQLADEYPDSDFARVYALP